MVLSMTTCRKTRRACMCAVLFYQIDWLVCVFFTCSDSVGEASSLCSSSVFLDVYNIDAYAPCETIEGFLYIRNTQLVNLDKLRNLKIINGYLHINNNPKLVNISGLAGVTQINGDIEIWNNPVLLSLEGFASLAGSVLSLSIYNNAALIDLMGLEFVTSVQESLRVNNNAALPSIDGLHRIETGEWTLPYLTLPSCRAVLRCDVCSFLSRSTLVYVVEWHCAGFVLL